MEVIHASTEGGSDYTLCGFGSEGEVCLDPETKDIDGPPRFAVSGEIVTCRHCRRIIAYCKTFKRNKQP